LTFHQQYYADVLAAESTVEQLTQVFSAALVDYEVLHVLASTFMEVRSFVCNQTGRMMSDEGQKRALIVLSVQIILIKLEWVIVNQACDR